MYRLPSLANPLVRPRHPRTPPGVEGTAQTSKLPKKRLSALHGCPSSQIPSQRCSVHCISPSSGADLHPTDGAEDHTLHGFIPALNVVEFMCVEEKWHECASRTAGTQLRLSSPTP
eukprot:EG_transcript_54402